jgi:hypothetical protein
MDGFLFLCEPLRWNLFLKKKQDRSSLIKLKTIEDELLWLKETHRQLAIYWYITHENYAT